MSKRRVVVTGMGCVTPYGIGVNTLWNNLKAGISGIKEHNLDKDKHLVKVAGQVPLDLNIDEYVDPKEAKRLDKSIIYALIAAEEAFRDSGLDLEKEDKTRIGTIVSTAAGGLVVVTTGYKDMMARGFHKCSPFTVPMMIANMASGKVSIKYGLRGPSKAVLSACATGAHSVGDSFRTIQYGDADIMFAGGAESSVCDFGIGAFTSARTLSKSTRPAEEVSRPYDAERDGFVLSEGGAVLILEEREHAIARGARIYAELTAYGQSSDAYDMVAPDPEGRGAELAIRNCLKEGNKTPDDVDYINMHGTSTHLGDIAESNTVARIFGDKNKNKKLCVSSTKSMTGHMLGAAGSAEAIVAVKTITEGIVPPTINIVKLDPEVADLDYVANKAKAKDVKVALSNSFGFGGHNAVLMFEKA
ncbi:TPA: beta-ketoacyl-ACP synthase II [Candidatus Avigastranaerophilus faecigallinarum]|nr:beta-ketoacyl-ACP synthase II [Candidatus Avigastranaerophilus faecigallinarum]